MQKRVMILTGGHLPKVQLCQQCKATIDMLICADMGIEYAQQLGWQPDLILGDFDSASPEAVAVYRKQGCMVQTYPRMKDYTDTHLAVEAALESGATEIIILGGTGTRLDHTLGNIQLLKRIANDGAAGQIIDDHNTITVITDTFIIHGQSGDLVSLLPLTEQVTGVTLNGLQYPLHDATLSIGNPIGISNVLTGETATVQLRSGALIVIKPID